MSTTSFNPCCDEHMQVAQNNVRAAAVLTMLVFILDLGIFPATVLRYVEIMTDDSITQI